MVTLQPVLTGRANQTMTFSGRILLISTPSTLCDQSESSHSLQEVSISVWTKQILLVHLFTSLGAYRHGSGKLENQGQDSGLETQQQAATNAPTITFSISSHFYIDLIPATTAGRSILRENIWIWNVSRIPLLLLPDPIPQFSAFCVTTAFSLASHFLT